MKNILVLCFIFFCIIVSGCSASSYETTGEYALPEGLKDCKIYTIKPEGLSYEKTVIRCPNSNTTTIDRIQSGKTSVEYSTTIVE